MRWFLVVLGVLLFGTFVRLVLFPLNYANRVATVVAQEVDV